MKEKTDERAKYEIEKIVKYFIIIFRILNRK